VVDLPGTYSLTANSLEEKIARDFILQERPDVVVMIANAAAIERNLYLLAELLCLPVRVVLGINMMDVAAVEGIEIEAHVLSAALGMVVVPMVASRPEGVSTLLTEAARLAQNPVGFNPARPEIGAATAMCSRICLNCWEILSRSRIRARVGGAETSRRRPGNH
jgi:ferrous iron transport protein B